MIYFVFENWDGGSSYPVDNMAQAMKTVSVCLHLARVYMTDAERIGRYVSIEVLDEASGDFKILRSFKV